MQRAAVEVPGKKYCSSKKLCPTEDFAPGRATCRTHLAQRTARRQAAAQDDAAIAEDIADSIEEDWFNGIIVDSETPSGDGQNEDDSVDVAADELSRLNLNETHGMPNLNAHFLLNLNVTGVQARGKPVNHRPKQIAKSTKVPPKELRSLQAKASKQYSEAAENTAAPRNGNNHRIVGCCLLIV